jgi:hypothetical protein
MIVIVTVITGRVLIMGLLCEMEIIQEISIIEKGNQYEFAKRDEMSGYSQ